MTKIIKGYILEADVECPKELRNFHHSYQKERKLKKYDKLVCNIYVKENYVVHITGIESCINNKKLHRVI